MFTKALIFVLLGTSLVLATPLNEDVAEQQIDKTWREKVNDFFNKIDTILAKTYKKGKESFDKVLTIVKLKSKEFAELVKAKWAKLQERFHEIKNKFMNDFQEKKKLFAKKIQAIRRQGIDVSNKIAAYVAKTKAALQLEYVKVQAKTKEWYQNVKEVIDNTRQTLEEKSFIDILNKYFGKYLPKNKLERLKNEYDRLKKEAKSSLEKMKKELSDELEELRESSPDKYEELKSRLSKILAKEKAKWESLINNVRQQIATIVKNVKGKLKDKDLEEHELIEIDNY